MQNKFCWPDGQGKQYCITAEDKFDENIGIIHAYVWEEEYPIQYCKTKLKLLEEQTSNESNLSGNTSPSSET
jgi:hypothetical protein